MFFPQFLLTLPVTLGVSIDLMYLLFPGFQRMKMTKSTPYGVVGSENHCVNDSISGSKSVQPCPLCLEIEHAVSLIKINAEVLSLSQHFFFYQGGAHPNSVQTASLG